MAGGSNFQFSIFNSVILCVGEFQAGFGVGHAVGLTHLAERRAVDDGEKDIRLEILINPGHIQPVNQREEVAVDSAAAHDKGFLLPFHHAKHLRHAVCHLQRARCRLRHFIAEPLVVRQHDVAPFGQRFLGQGVERAPSHNDSVAACEGLKPFQVVAEMPQQIVVAADSHILRHRHDDGKVVFGSNINHN